MSLIFSKAKSFEHYLGLWVEGVPSSSSWNSATNLTSVSVGSCPQALLLHLECVSVTEKLKLLRHKQSHVASGSHRPRIRKCDPRIETSVLLFRGSAGASCPGWWWWRPSPGWLLWRPPWIWRGREFCLCTWGDLTSLKNASLVFFWWPMGLMWLPWTPLAVSVVVFSDLTLSRLEGFPSWIVT